MGDLIRELKTKSDFDSLKAEAASRVIIIDFYATWCGPCKMISPVFDRYAGQWRQAIFSRCDVDRNPDLAKQFNVTAMPTFAFVKNGKKVGEMKGANPQGLEAAIRQHVGAPDPTYSAASSSAGASTSSAHSASGASLLGQINKPQSTCLNEASAHPLSSVFTSGSSSYLESDADEQLLLNLEMQQALKLRALRIASSAAGQAPKTLKLFINRPNGISFDDAEVEKATQEMTLTAEQAEGKAEIPLRFVAFQRVQSLQIFVKDNQGGEDTTRIDSLDLFGETLEGTQDLKAALQSGHEH